MKQDNLLIIGSFNKWVGESIAATRSKGRELTLKTIQLGSASDTHKYGCFDRPSKCDVHNANLANVVKIPQARVALCHGVSTNQQVSSVVYPWSD